MSVRRVPTIVVCDEFLPDPDAIRQLALEQEFLASDSHKGRRTRGQFLAEEIKAAFEALLGRTITRWESHAMNGTFQICNAMDPLVIHSDIQTHAAILYLTPDAPPEAGTSFYRSRITKLRASPTKRDAERLGVSIKDLESLMYRGNLFDRTKWVEVDRIGNVYNRLVLWDAKLVHSASCYFGSEPGDCRLFQMFFFDA